MKNDENAIIKKLQQCRQKINEVDDQLLSLIIKRLTIVEEIGEIKEKVAMVINDPEREKEIILRLANEARGRLSIEQIERIFSMIFLLSKDIQNKG